jgi:hypothetical protein
MIPSDALRNRLYNDFTFHPAAPGGQRALDHDRVRLRCGELARELSFVVPEGRELSLALTNLEQAMFWANAGIARQS